MRLGAATAAACIAAVALPAAAVAEVERPWQLAGARAEGLAYTPVAPTVQRKVCLVDTGVNQNADTARVTTRLSLDGTQVEDTSGGAAHGTLMAMHMAAERNGTGMVGLWPQGEIVSYRANQPGTLSFSFADYYRAINDCGEVAGVSVINLSIGTSRQPTELERERLVNAIGNAREVRGISVVASAGNSPGPVESPGSFPGVLTISSTNADGAGCPSSASGPEVEMQAPGCDLEDANPFALDEPGLSSGTSQASAMAAQVLAALRGYAPELTRAQAEEALTACGPALDAECALRRVGRGDVIDAGLAALPTQMPPRERGRKRRRFAKPRLLWSQACFQRSKARRCVRGGWRPYRQRGRRVVLRVVKLPRGATLEVRAYARRVGRRTRARKIRDLVRMRARVAFTLPRHWARLRVRFVPTTGVETEASRPVYILRRG